MAPQIWQSANSPKKRRVGFLHSINLVLPGWIESSSGDPRGANPTLIHYHISAMQNRLRLGAADT